MTPSELAVIKSTVLSAKNILLVTHKDPDFDHRDASGGNQSSQRVEHRRVLDQAGQTIPTA